MFAPFNRRFIPRSVKLMLLRMSVHLSARELAQISGVSTRTLRRICRLWCTTGNVTKENILCGRQRVLHPMDLEVCTHYIRLQRYILLI
jgi:hypothetical protein